jgi:pyruvate dehydrogenase (quinone)
MHESRSLCACLHGRTAVEEALAHSGPALVEVMSARQELIMPPTTMFDEARKFS